MQLIEYTCTDVLAKYLLEELEGNLLKTQPSPSPGMKVWCYPAPFVQKALLVARFQLSYCFWAIIFKNFGQGFPLAIKGYIAHGTAEPVLLHCGWMASSIVCPGGGKTCQDDMTCCQLPSGQQGCCPFKNAVCCSDKVHCCPQGTICDIKGGLCLKEDLDIQLLS
ncbi:unnamed protein product [Timema podura]|uniref:Granulins domain-containing protein n=1 Tax=Timema podura TaxID=61482 RepID=A0ABN7NSH9_TIMPD|nr:unnamed protein product [Timema podura]